ncbi:hypothetical protein FKW77_006679 [Venturia effusa]|uniref:HNH nuclease domain-containing protein n=1 Tax=Venturia effusa TaxID=50376 RepID=A0A517L5K0_9PEZI|nr:hypothetical protein FKW77_006679 [Venturia effusa]
MNKLFKSGKVKRTVAELEQDLQATTNDLNNQKKRLKPQSSFDEQYWTKAAQVGETKQQITQLKHQISVATFQSENQGASIDEYFESEDGKNFLVRLKAEEIETNNYKKQAERMKSSGSEMKQQSQAFLKFFLTSSLGLQLKGPTAGDRDTRDQSQFRAAMIEAYNLRNPNPKLAKIWCPFLGDWVLAQEMQASHIFPYRYGQDTMSAIFGEDANGELFSYNNGLMLHQNVEKYFEKGLFCIVPKINDPRDVAEVQKWDQDLVKEYMVRIIDNKHPYIDQEVASFCGKTWRQMDGMKLRFRNNERPRARYLYFHMVCMLLQHTWNKDKKGAVPATMKDQLGNVFWGSRGKYMKQSMILAFIDQMGHDYDQLLENATPDKQQEEEEIALAVASDLLLSAAKHDLGETEEEEDEEEEEEEEYDDDED